MAVPPLTVKPRCGVDVKVSVVNVRVLLVTVGVYLAVIVGGVPVARPAQLLVLLWIVAVPTTFVGFGLAVPLHVVAVAVTLVVSAEVPPFFRAGLKVIVPVTFLQL